MYTFRAINERDYWNLKTKKCILCSASNKKIGTTEREQLIFLRSALDTLIGHINGKTLANNESFWISSSKSLKFVAGEYAIPQNGNYNTFNGRKPIMIIDAKNDNDNISMLIKDETRYFADEINSDIRNKFDMKYLAFDLSNDFLGILLENKIIYPANMKYIEYSKDDVKGISGFAKKAKEVVHFIKIPEDMIKGFITPLATDILYPFMNDNNTDLIDSFLNDIESNNSKIKLAIEDVYKRLSLNEQELFRLMYEDILTYKIDFSKDFSYYTKTLSEIAKDKCIEFNYDFIELYELLKNFKREMLKDIYIELINLRFLNDEQINTLKKSTVIPIVDDEVYVLSFISKRFSPQIIPKDISIENKIYKLKKDKKFCDIVMIELEDKTFVVPPIKEKDIVKKKVLKK